MIRKMLIEVRHKFMTCNSQIDQNEKLWLIEIAIKTVKKHKKRKTFQKIYIIVLFLLHDRLGSVSYFNMLGWGRLLGKIMPINIRYDSPNKLDNN